MDQSDRWIGRFYADHRQGSLIAGGFLFLSWFETKAKE